MKTMKNMDNFDSFKGLKKSSTLNEDVIQMGDAYRVRGFDVPLTLVNAFKKKAKDAGQDITGKFADTELAEFISKYVATTFLTIDNLPLEVLGTDYSNVQVQPQTQVQEPVQPVQDPIQDVQNTQVQDTLQDIPAQEGQSTQNQVQNQTQIQNQTQNTQEI